MRAARLLFLVLLLTPFAAIAARAERKLARLWRAHQAMSKGRA